MLHLRENRADTRRRTARIARQLIVAVALVLSAACGNVGDPGRPSLPDPTWWLDILSPANQHLLEAIDKSCPPEGLLGNEKCVKAKIVEIFAKQNSAGTHCPTDETAGALLMCVDLFTATERIYRTMSLDPQQAMDWDDPYASFRDLENVIATRLAAKCPDSPLGDCAAREMTILLPISLQDARRCAVADMRRNVGCATGVVRIEDYQIARRDAG